MKMVGSQVAAGRVAKNLTQRQLGELVRLDAETIASIEQGRRALMPNVAELMDLHLGLPGLLTVAANEMPLIDTVPPWAADYMDLEKRALALSWYESIRIPGLLQTENHARALFRDRVPAHSEEEIEALTVGRLGRQEVLHRAVPPSISFVVWEAAFQVRIGGRQIYREQLRHLLHSTELPNVTLQILPFGQTTHPGLNGPFILLETPDHQHVGYAETQRGSLLVSNADEVSILARKYAMLRTQALNTVETQGLLVRLLGET
ncbi:helix-turn-helix domain-containing protein [Streptomyces yangpuensis]